MGKSSVFGNRCLFDAFSVVDVVVCFVDLMFASVDLMFILMSMF